MKKHKYTIEITATNKTAKVTLEMKATGEIQAIKTIYSDAVDVQYIGGRLGEPYYSEWLVWHKSQIIANVRIS